MPGKLKWIEIEIKIKGKSLRGHGDFKCYLMAFRGKIIYFVGRFNGITGSRTRV